MEEKNTNTKKPHSNKNTLFVLCMAVLMLLSFAGGYFVRRLTYGNESQKVNEVIELIDKVGYVYDPTTDSYVELDGDKVAEIIAKNFLDQYSAYYTKDEYEKVLAEDKGEYTGFGMSYLKTEKTTLQPIYSIVGNSPAFYSGLNVGDIITGAKKTTDVTITQFSTHQQLSEFLAQAEKGESYDFYVQGKAEPVSLIKDDFIATYVEYYDSETALTFTYDNKTLTEQEKPRPADVLSELNGNEDVFYVVLKSFQGNAFEEMEKAFKYAKQHDKTQLVLDLRNNGGGSMEILEQIASLVIDGQGSQVKLVSAVGKKQTTHYNTDKDRFDGFIEKISVIANEKTASASECLIGAMLYHHGEKYLTAEIVADRTKYNNTECTVFGYGRLVIVKNSDGDAKTYGKGIMQTTYQLRSGGALKVTTAKLMWPDYNARHETGTSIHGIGILPKVDVEGANPNTMANAVDNANAIARAIATLNENALILTSPANP